VRCPAVRVAVRCTVCATSTTKTNPTTFDGLSNIHQSAVENTIARRLSASVAVLARHAPMCAPRGCDHTVIKLFIEV
jgi:hypothetical protein